jgi:hypothetical protein
VAYKITVDQPNLAKGTDVFIDGLGTFKNGETQTVSNEQVSHFRNAHGRVNDQGTWEQGPTLGQAFPVEMGITVERVSEQQEQPRQQEPAPEPPAPPQPKKKEGGK